MEQIENDRKNLLGKEDITKLLFKFATPSVIAMLVGALYNIVDQIYIGNSVGILGNAATNVSFPLTTICLSIALMSGIGSAACFNLKIGKREYDDAQLYIGNGVFLMFFFGIILMVITQIFLTPLLVLFGSTSEILPYAKEYTNIISLGFPLMIAVTAGSHIIRADGSPVFSMVCTLVGCITNIILDPIFIFKFDMGVKGAALATVIGQFLSTVLVIRYLSKFKTVDLSIKDFFPKFKYCIDVIKIGIGPFFNQITILFVQIVLNNLFRHYGALSPYGSNGPLAAIGVIMKINMIFFSIAIGISQGLQPIISFNYGRKYYDRVILAVKKSFIFTFCISTIAFILFQVFPLQIIKFFGKGDAKYFEFAVKFFKIFLFFTFINGTQPIQMNMFTAIGKPYKAMFISLSRQIFFFIPLSIIFAHFWFIDGILYAALLSDFLANIISLSLTYKEILIMKKLL